MKSQAILIKKSNINGNESNVLKYQPLINQVNSLENFVSKGNPNDHNTGVLDINSPNIKTPYEVRQDFPFFQNAVKNRIYLDSAATTLKCKAALSAMDHIHKVAVGNVHRSSHSISNMATNIFENSRKQLVKYLHPGVSNYSKLEKNIAFVPSTTYGMNLLALSLKKHITPGSAIITSVADHHSSILVWHELAKITNSELIILPLEKDMSVNIEQIIDISKTKSIDIIALPHVSNVLGWTLDLQKLSDILAIIKSQPLVILDCAQSAGHQLIKLNEDKFNIVDIAVGSSHKMMGPSGSGWIYAKKNVHPLLECSIYGGAVVSSVNYSTALSLNSQGDSVNRIKINPEYRSYPSSMEPGTPAIADIAGLGAASEYLSTLNVKKPITRQDIISKIFKSIPNANLLGSVDGKIPLVSFTVNGIDSHDMCQLIDTIGNICIRSGHHCTEPLHHYLGISGSIRISAHVYNTEEDLDQLEESLKNVISILKE